MKAMRIAMLLALVGASAAARAAPLDDLRAALEPLRAAEVERGDNIYGATSQLTAVKHRLRDWIEQELGGLAEHDDVPALEARLNAELRGAGLLCPGGDGRAGAFCAGDERSGFIAGGYVGELRLRHDDASPFLVVTTAAGIDCGYDELAYLYAWTGIGWARRWQSEQGNYTKDGYAPQTLHDVLISPRDATGRFLVLTLGSQPWCQSNWRPIFYRLWRVGSDGNESVLLLDRTEQAFLGNDPPIRGRIGANDVLVSFTVADPDPAQHSRDGVRRYRIEGDSVMRIEPFDEGDAR